MSIARARWVNIRTPTVKQAAARQHAAIDPGLVDFSETGYPPHHRRPEAAIAYLEAVLIVLERMQA